MGPFESSVNLLSESLSDRERVLCAVNEALSPEERFLFEAVATAWLKFEPALRRPETSDTALWEFHGGSQVVAAARNLAFHVLRSRTPPRSVRNVSDVAKPFTTLRRQPTSVRAWFEKHKSKLLTLLSAKDWEPAEPGIPVGDFLVSDTTGNGGIDQIVKLVKSVSDKINRSGLPGASKILYGNVFITANLTGGLAFYRRRQDNIWIRPKTRFGPASEHSLAHELGHRYWHKILPGRVKVDWIEWDAELRETAKNIGKDAAVIFPRVGQPVPMQVRGFGSKSPRVIRVENRGRETRFYISKTDFLTDQQIRKFYQSRTREGLFPTPYSMQTNHDEHFSEAFGLRVLNKLDEPHSANFRKIVG